MEFTVRDGPYTPISVPGNLRFVHMPAVMQKRTLRNPLHLASGASDDRHGMAVIQNGKMVRIIAN